MKRYRIFVVALITFTYLVDVENSQDANKCISENDTKENAKWVNEISFLVGRKWLGGFEFWEWRFQDRKKDANQRRRASIYIVCCPSEHSTEPQVEMVEQTGGNYNSFSLHRAFVIVDGCDPEVEESWTTILRNF